MNKAQAMQAVAALFEENMGQRLTPTLVTGFMVLLNQALPDDHAEATKKPARRRAKTAQPAPAQGDEQAGGK